MEISTDMTSLSSRSRRSLRQRVDPFGRLMVDGFHLLALFAIGAATVWSAAIAFFEMMEKGTATIEDLLLLFIYLEIGAMVGVYFRTNRMPVRFLLYVAITALTRHLIGVISPHPGVVATASVPEYNALVISGAILILAVSVLVVRFGSFTYPSEEPDSGARGRRHPARRAAADARARGGPAGRTAA